MEEINRFWSNVCRKAKDLVPLQVFPAVVREVDEDLRTCKVRVNDNVDFVDVRLYALADSALKGFCLIPAVDSTVMVARIANSNELFVSLFSVVDKVLGTIGDKVEFSADAEQLHYLNNKTDITVKSGEVTATLDGVTLEIKGNKVKVDADEIVFNGGNNKGVPNVDDIKSNLDSIKNYLTAMNTAVSTGLNGVGLGPAASGTAGSAAYQGAMAGQSIVFGSMEDTKVKH